jgi:hypothetical protein
MADLAALQTELDAIEQRLSSGRTSVTLPNGARVDHNLTVLERRAEALRRQILAARQTNATTLRRVTFTHA